LFSSSEKPGSKMRTYRSNELGITAPRVKGLVAGESKIDLFCIVPHCSQQMLESIPPTMLRVASSSAPESSLCVRSRARRNVRPLMRSSPNRDWKTAPRRSIPSPMPFAAYGVPQKMLTDNGNAFSGNRQGWVVTTQLFLADHGRRGISGMPGHPQTQGMNERGHHTLEKVLYDHPDSLEQARKVIVLFRDRYTYRRHHQSVPGDMNPHQAWEAAVHAHQTEHRSSMLKSKRSRVSMLNGDECRPRWTSHAPMTTVTPANPFHPSLTQCPTAS
jgi:hypothetical protein